MDKNNIGLTGEMRVCAEFLKKGYCANIAFGNAKATDIIITASGGRFLRAEVKTSKNGKNFVTGFFQNTRMHPNPILTYGFSISQTRNSLLQAIAFSSPHTRRSKRCNSL